MKTILSVGFLFLVASVVRAEMDEPLMQAMQDDIVACAKEQDLSDEEVGLFLGDQIMEGDMLRKSGCFNACLMKRLGLLENGVIKPENIKSVTEKLYAYAPQDIPDKIDKLTKCSPKVAGITDECDLGAEFTKCLMS